MPKGISLHIGLDRVDKNHYGELRDLKAAVKDAETMLDLAKNTFKYEQQHILRNEEATSSRVLSALAEYALALEPGDILLLSYSGHGGQIDDQAFYTPEDKGPDETWCLYDRQLLDDELFEAFLQFKEGVRILILSDSCHSGTMSRAIKGDEPPKDAVEALIVAALQQLERTDALRPKEMRDNKPYGNHFEKVYRPIMERLKKSAGHRKRRVNASVKLLAACQDNQVAYDGLENGRFTGALKTLIANRKLRNKTSAKALLKLLTNPYTTPNLLDYGPIIPAFDQYNPFLVNIPDAAVATGYRQPPSDESAPNSYDLVQPHNAPPTPIGNPLSVSILFKTGRYEPSKLFPLLPMGVGGMRLLRDDTVIVEFKPGSHPNVWDIVHHIVQKAEGAGISIEVEPAQTASFPVADPTTTATRASGSSFDYMEQWPPANSDTVVPFAWHLGPDYSELAAARDRVMAALETGQITKRVRIAHFDTGYFPSHPAIWDNKNILRDLARSFVPGEIHNKAIDIYYGDGEVQGHGLGTLTLLAGWQVPKAYTDNEDIGYLGGAPCAEVIPMRIGDGVVILEGETFAAAVDYAIETGCEVITMSRGGKPSPKMARAVNKAYEAGIVIVTAAGNSIVDGLAKIGPRTVVWPARFQRVIAACGVCQNHRPYDFDAQRQFAPIRSTDYDKMQGNWGPEAAMHYAMAAYTPNMPWAIYQQERYFRKSGGGTSSATPQIAAAAALYIMQHRAELEAEGYYQPGQQWKKVEAVRHALFTGAFLPPDFQEAKRYYGKGILKALRALEVPVLKKEAFANRQPAPAADSSLFGLAEALGLFFNRRRAEALPSATQQQAFTLEISHVLMSDPKLADLHDGLSYESTWSEATAEQVMLAVKGSTYCSQYLRAML